MLKKTVLPFIVIIISFLFGACNSKTKDAQEISEMQHNMDSVFASAGNFNEAQKAQANEMIKAYMNYAEQYPEDSLSPKFLFESSRIQLMIPDYPAAISILETIPQKYPDDALAPTALSTAAALCENILKNCAKAAEYLNQLKEKYPHHPAAVNIDLQIEYVCDPEGYLNAVTGKTDSMIVNPLVDTLQ